MRSRTSAGGGDPSHTKCRKRDRSAVKESGCFASATLSNEVSVSKGGSRTSALSWFVKMSAQLNLNQRVEVGVFGGRSVLQPLFVAELCSRQRSGLQASADPAE